MKPKIHDILTFLLYGIAFVGIIDMIAQATTHGTVQPIRMIIEIFIK